mmetsp:Transcript_7501/g.21340  ORF Transcript_7501/g.21340 Transcript_7501/m.21340 type:complete len:783 (+) Transcript_7501:97-2445(+)|eukprot:CAMPEP_0119126782 /NCGR_PEP_ID=MMETSP1310-20130426/5570_1 /TAXON_ID=464262 /ORGANISM="Genus nov. species nov., Strain RCC2339" /LENGTH=782 /DNA_ID=CAMNT_0007116967 /DNA_START=95 /DNA_END=2443 /DNA_ORIENTATION=-
MATGEGDVPDFLRSSMRTFGGEDGLGGDSSTAEPPRKRQKMGGDGGEEGSSNSSMSRTASGSGGGTLRESSHFGDLQTFLDHNPPLRDSNVFSGQSLGLRDSAMLRESGGLSNLWTLRDSNMTAISRGGSIRDSEMINPLQFSALQSVNLAQSTAGVGAPAAGVAQSGTGERDAILQNFLTSWEKDGGQDIDPSKLPPGVSNNLAEFLRSSGITKLSAMDSAADPRSGGSAGNPTFASDVTSVRPLSPTLSGNLNVREVPLAAASGSINLSASSDPLSSLQIFTEDKLTPGESVHPPWFPPYQFTVAAEALAHLDGVERVFKVDIKKTMAELHARLKKLQVSPLDKTEASNLESMQTRLKQAVRKCFYVLDSFLIGGTVLPPRSLNKLTVLRRDIGIEERQLGLLVSELQHFMNPSNALPTLAMLVVAKQPFPKPIKKGIKVCGADGAHEEPTLVRLLQNSRSVVKPMSKVKAEVIYEDYHEREGTFTSDTVAMDTHGFASFYNLKFSKATRKKVARLQFSVTAEFTLEGGREKHVLPIQSESSAPFIVFTNESQWEESESILLKKEAFPSNEVSFARFANYLQMHFLRSTRQDPFSPERALSLHDLNYLARAKLGDKDVITKSDFDEFLKWFGKVLRKIRHQQNFHTLWVKGLVYGFIGRGSSEKLLAGRDDGTFLVRFSESESGKVVITSVHKKKDGRKTVESFQHFLIAPGKHESPFRLLDIIKQQSKYTKVVVVSPEFCAKHETTMTEVPKDEAFKAYYLKKEKPTGLQKHYIVDDQE